MTSPVINSHIRSPCLSHISVKLIPGAYDFFRQYAIQKLTGLLASLLAPILEGPITISHRLLDGRSLLQQLLKFRKERLKDGKLGCFYSIRYLLGSNGLTSKHFYLLQISEEVEIFLVNGPLLVLGDILEGDNRFCGRFELHFLPLGIIGEGGILHYNQICINDMVIFQNIS